MYLHHYGLNKMPFDISPDPRFLWLGETHKEALAYLKYGIMGNRRFMVVTGDVTQIDLPPHKPSGLVEAMHALRKVDGVALIQFSKRDVVRHPLVQRIIQAYEDHRGTR